MLKRIIAWSVTHKLLVLLGTAAVTLAGIGAMLQKHLRNRPKTGSGRHEQWRFTLSGFSVDIGATGQQELGDRLVSTLHRRMKARSAARLPFIHPRPSLDQQLDEPDSSRSDGAAE